ncbi:MAG: glycosyltransferase [Haloarculaceae archaeon]
MSSNRRIDAELWVPTKDSEKTLHATLASVRALDPAPQRVRIVDGGSSDDTDEIAQSFDIDVVNQGNARGLSGGRNVALRKTDTTYLAFVDDDVQPRPDWLGCLVEELDTHNAGAATAPIRHYPTTVAERWGVERLQFNDPGDERVTDRIPGANGVYRVSAVREIGGWDEENYPFGGEDVNLSRRLREAHALRYVPETYVIHEPVSGIEPVIKLWHWHTQNGPPENVPHLLLRAVEHLSKSFKYIFQDLRRGHLEFFPFDLAVAPVHMYLDFSGYYEALDGDNQSTISD